MKILVCGGAGFIGSNFIRYMLKKYPDYSIVNFDKLTYAGNPDNVKDVSEEFEDRYSFTEGDICNRELLTAVIKEHKIDHIVNFAAETHVDRSIHGDCTEFSRTNTIGVLTLLNVVRDSAKGNGKGIAQFVNVSTDEVYGSLELEDPGKFTEDSPFLPNMPYAAAKAGGDLMCRSYFVIHKVPIIVTHCSNNYGPYQYPEKLIPASVFRLLKDMPLLIHGDGLNVRDWIHVDDHCSALDILMHKGESGEVYNIGADNERNNLEIAKTILRLMGKPEDMLQFVEDRPGNDRRYAIDSVKIQKMGWVPKYPRDEFETGMKESIDWYLKNEDWVKNSWEKHVNAYKINHTLTLRKKQEELEKIF